MLLHVLGSCSGTEPMAGRHHTSVTLETGRNLYFLDAGEGCAYSSYLLGIDQLATRGIFISHTHMDHVGGLPHLLWNLRKLCTLSPEAGRRMKNREIPIFLPNLSVFHGIYEMLLGSEGNYETDFSLCPKLLQDGPFFSDGVLSLEALHNFHLGEPAPGEPWKSFSFSACAEGKRVFYSGDFRDLSELLPAISGADLVLLETGHHRAFALCRELRESGIPFGNVLFFHHGVEILRDFSGELALACRELPGRVRFAEDGMSIRL